MREPAMKRGADVGSTEDTSTHLIHGPASPSRAVETGAFDDHVNAAYREHEAAMRRGENSFEAMRIAIRAAFEVRPHGTVTDAEVEAAAEAICWAAEAESLLDVRMDMRAQYMREARAALEAAREVHP